MADMEWHALPTALWPSPAIWTDAGDVMLLVFTQDGVPTWEIRRSRACPDDLRAFSPLIPLRDERARP
jgi:hypothetical protein